MQILIVLYCQKIMESKVCVDDKFSSTFESCFGEDPIYKFINCIIEGNKYWGDVMKKNFN